MMRLACMTWGYALNLRQALAGTPSPHAALAEAHRVRLGDNM